MPIGTLDTLHYGCVEGQVAGEGTGVEFQSSRLRVTNQLQLETERMLNALFVFVYSIHIGFGPRAWQWTSFFLKSIQYCPL